MKRTKIILINRMYSNSVCVTITFNGITNLSIEEEKVDEFSVGTRMIWQYLFQNNHNFDKENGIPEDYTEFLEDIKKFTGFSRNQWSVSFVVDVIKLASGRNGVILLIDEFRKLLEFSDNPNPEKEVANTISLLASQLMNDKGFHVIITTLDSILIEKIKTNSGTPIHWVKLSSPTITEIVNLFEKTSNHPVHPVLIRALAFASGNFRLYERLYEEFVKIIESKSKDKDRPIVYDEVELQRVPYDYIRLFQATCS